MKFIKYELEDLWKISSLKIKFILILSLFCLLPLQQFIKTPLQSSNKSSIFIVVKNIDNANYYISTLDKYQIDKHIPILKKNIFMYLNSICLSKIDNNNVQQAIVVCKHPQFIGTIEQITIYTVEKEKLIYAESQLVPVKFLRYTLIIFIWFIIFLIPIYLWTIKNVNLSLIPIKKGKRKIFNIG